MKLGGVIRMNKNLVLFMFGLLLLLLMRYSAMHGVFEGLSNEEALYYDKDTYDPAVYDSFKQKSDGSMTADHWKNLNPYDNNLLPIDTNPRPLSESTRLQQQQIQNTEPGVPKKDIPFGQEDLYILKSKIVPPVCPACPAAVQGEKNKCPPCPACERCPEPNFTCKKVPNYRNMDANKLPDFLPRLANSNHF